MKSIHAPRSLKRKFLSVLLAVMMLAQCIPAGIVSSLADVTDQSGTFSPIQDLDIQSDTGEPPQAEAGGTSTNYTRQVQLINELPAGQPLPWPIFLTINDGTADLPTILFNGTYTTLVELENPLNTYQFVLNFGTETGGTAGYNYTVTTSDTDNKVFIKISSGVAATRNVRFVFANGADRSQAPATFTATVMWGTDGSATTSFGAGEATGTFAGVPSGMMDFQYSTDLSLDQFNVSGYTEPTGDIVFVVSPKETDKAQFLVVKEWINTPDTMQIPMNATLYFSGIGTTPATQGQTKLVPVDFVMDVPAAGNSSSVLVPYETFSDGFTYNVTPKLAENIPSGSRVVYLGTAEIKDGTGKVVGMKVFNTVTVDVKVRKSWTGEYNFDFPTAIEVDLKNGAGSYRTGTITNNGPSLADWGNIVIPNVPLADMNGPFVYTVHELYANSNVSTTYSGNELDGFTITNRVIRNPEDDIQVKIFKEWAGVESGDTTVSASFTITCLNDPTFLPTTVALNNGAGNAAEATRKLPRYVTGSDPKVDRIYYVTETATSPKYILTTQKQLGNTWLFVNTKNELRLSGTKNWVEPASPQPMVRPAVTIYLKRDGQYLKTDRITTTTNPNDPDVIKYTELEGPHSNASTAFDFGGAIFPRFDENGRPYVYTLEEVMTGTNSTMYRQTHSGMTVTNTYVGNNPVTVNKFGKEWVNPDNKWFYDGAGYPSVQIELWRSDDATLDMPGDFRITTVTIPAGADSAIWYYLPGSIIPELLDGKYYFFHEEPSGSVDPARPWAAQNNGVWGPFTLQQLAAANGIVMKNEMTGNWGNIEEQNIQLRIEKNWVVTQPMGLTVSDLYANFAITRNGAPYTPDASAFLGYAASGTVYNAGTGVATVYGNGYVTFTLPGYDPVTHQPYVYGVDEVSVMGKFPADAATSGFGTSCVRTGNTFKFTNTQDLLPIHAEKQWDMSNYAALSGKVLDDYTLSAVTLGFLLKRGAPGMSAVTIQTAAQNVWFRSGTTFTNEVELGIHPTFGWTGSGWEKYTYTVDEVFSSSDELEDTDFNMQGLTSVDAAGNVVLVNKYTKGANTVDVKAKKTWFGLVAPLTESDFTVEIQLQKLVSGSYVNEGAPVTLPHNGKWEYTFADQPKKNGNDLISYRVVETKVNGVAIDARRQAKVRIGLEDYLFQATVSPGTYYFAIDNRLLIENPLETFDLIATKEWNIPKLPGQTDEDYAAYFAGFTDANPVIFEIYGDDPNPPRPYPIRSVAFGTPPNLKVTFEDLPVYKTDRNAEGKLEKVVYYLSEDLTNCPGVIGDVAKRIEWAQDVTGAATATLKNTVATEEKTVTVSKTFSKADGSVYDIPAALRDNLWVRVLFTNGISTYPLLLHKGNGWTATRTLPSMNGTEYINYVVTEEVFIGEPGNGGVRMPAGDFVLTGISAPVVKNGGAYILTMTSANITFTMANQIVTDLVLKGTKVWDDLSNLFRLRPVSFTLTTKAADVADIVSPFTTDMATNSKTYAYAVPMYDSNGNRLTPEAYTVTENPHGNASYILPGQVRVAKDGTYTITNKMELVNVNITKDWADDSNAFGTRPANLQLAISSAPALAAGLPASLTMPPKAGNQWSVALPTAVPKKMPDGTTIVYTATETTPKNYENDATYKASDDTQDGYTIKLGNKLKLTQPKGDKTWVGDGEYASILRPASITVKLMRNDPANPGNPPTEVLWNGAPMIMPVNVAGLTGGSEIEDGTWPANASDWKVPAVDPEGRAYTYSVVELTSLKSYTVTQTPGDPMSLRNTLKSGSITVTKSWDDILAGVYDHSGLRPDSVSITLEGKTQVLPLSVTITKTAELKAATGWSHTFSGLPLTDNAGNPIHYTVKEVTVNGYSLKGTVPTVTLVGIGDSKTIAFTNKIDLVTVTAKKQWSGEYDVKQRPASLEFELLRDGAPLVPPVKLPVTTTAAMNGQEPAVVFSNLPARSRTDNHLYDYSVRENPAQIPGYLPGAVTETTLNSPIVTNKMDSVDIKGVKVWAGDDNNAEGTRQNYKINILQKGSATAEITFASQTIPHGTLTWSFTGLPKKDPLGVDYVYTVTEDAVNGYVTTIDQANLSNVTVTNTLEKAADITGTKTWAGDAFMYTSYTAYGGEAAYHALVSGQVTIHLDRAEASGAYSVTSYRTAGLTASGANWVYTFTNLPKTAPNGNAYTYTVREVFANAAYTQSQSGYNFTNTFKTVGVDLSKIWDDAADKSMRPASVTIRVHGKVVGVPSDGYDWYQDYTIPATSADTWTLSPQIQGLPRYSAYGNLITYSVSETQIGGYLTPDPGQPKGDATTDPYALSVRNTLDTGTIPFAKQWSGDAAYPFARPSEYTVELWRKNASVDELVETKTLSGATLTYNFGPYPKSDGSNLKYTYYVKEQPMLGYTPALSGMNITNALNTIDLTVTKAWPDDIAAERPASVQITVTGTAGSATVYTNTITVSAPTWVNSALKGLPKYAWDNAAKKFVEIVYTVSETRVSGYEEPEYTQPVAPGYAAVVTNKVKKHTDIEGVKAFAGDVAHQAYYANYYTAGPAVATRVHINLYRSETAGVFGGVPYQTTGLVYQGGAWTYRFTNLRAESPAGTPYYYKVEEAMDTAFGNAYTLEKSGEWSFRNTLKVVDVRIAKIWDDNGNAENSRKSVTVTLTGEGSNGYRTTQTVTLTAAHASGSDPNRWVYPAITGLPLYDGYGTLITYTISESPTPAGYDAPTYAQAAMSGTATGYDFAVTNKLSLAGTITGAKIWSDGGNKYLTQPDQILITLYRSSAATAETAVPGHINLPVTAPWSWSFSGLPDKDNANNPYTYYVKETPLTGYDTPSNAAPTMDVTNNVKTVSLEVEKKWLNDEAASRPDSVQVTVTGTALGGTVYPAAGESNTFTVSAANGWKATIDGLPRYTFDSATRQYVLIDYTVAEAQLPGYKAPVLVQPTASAQGNYAATVTNELDPISITATKSWIGDDAMIAAGFSPRPATITFQLHRSVGGVTDGAFDALNIMQTVTVTAGATQTVTFPVSLRLSAFDKTGTPYTYFVTESIVYGYTTNAPVDVTFAGKSGTVTVTNTLDEMTVSGKKAWVDYLEDGEYKTRPASINIILTRSVDGVPDSGFSLTQTLAYDNTKTEQTFSFTGLPTRRATDGKAYVYDVNESPALLNYVTTKAGSAATGFTVTNTLDALPLNFTKIWNDIDNKAFRPDSITVTLVGVGTDGRTYYQQTQVLTKADQTAKGNDQLNNWQTVFANIPRKGLDGGLITYTISEGAIPRYTATSVTQPQSSAGASVYTAGITNAIATDGVTFTKTWTDGNNKYGTRPAQIEVRLMRKAVGTETEDVEVVGWTNVNANGATGNVWTRLFSGVVMTDGSGAPYTFYAEEKPVNGYTAAYDGAAAGEKTLAITNTLRTKALEVRKLWITSGNDAQIPASITLQVSQGGTPVSAAPTSFEKTTATEWTWIYGDLPAVGANGSVLNYIARETDALPNYDKTASDVFSDTVDRVTLTNTLKLVNVEVNKTWLGEIDSTQRPASLVVKLTASAAGFAEQSKDLAAQTPKWSATFRNLPMLDRDGNPITYTATETTPVHGYEATTPAGTATTSRADANGKTYTVTLANTQKKTSVTVTKVWDDNDNPARPAASSLTIELTRVPDGVRTTRTAPATQSGNTWTYVFDNLLSESMAGVPFTYTADETAVPSGYEKSVLGHTITNKLLTDAVTGGKTWVDQYNIYDTRPDEIVVKLQRSKDGTAWEDVPDKTTGQPLTYRATPPNWTWAFPNVDSHYSEGGASQAYQFRVVEITVLSNYDVSYTAAGDGMNLTNTLKVAAIEGSKAWEPATGFEWLKPAQFIVTLQKKVGADWVNVTVNGADVTRIARASNGWTWNFGNLPAVDESGNAISYRVQEETLPAWTDAYPAGTYNIVNTLKTGDLTVTKQWLGENGDTSQRPASLIVTVTSSDPNDTTERKANLASTPTHVFDGLPLFTKDGTPIRYTATENTPVFGYTATTPTASVILTASGAVLTLQNTLKTQAITVTKEWIHNGNPNPPAQDSLAIMLIRSDGHTETKYAPTSTAGGLWLYVFENLLVENKDTGVPYTYTADEVAPPAGYAKSVNGYKVTNTFVTGEITGHKIWDDQNNRFDTRPAEYTVQLECSEDGLIWNVATNGAGAAQILTLGANIGAFGFVNVVLTSPAGRDYVFRIREVNVDKRYEASYDDETNTVTNRLIVTDIRGVKRWDVTADLYPEAKPANITVRLTVGGVTVQDIYGSEMVRTVPAIGAAWAFLNLPALGADGAPIDYVVVEDPLTGFDATTPQGTHDILNTLKTVDITVTKNWTNENNDTSNRPANLVVTLTALNLPGFAPKTFDLATAADWKHTFEDLPQFNRSGDEVVYSVTEPQVIGYTQVIGAATIAPNGSGTYSLALENRLAEIDITVQKLWVDFGKAAETRPASIDITLTASNGAPDRTATLDLGNGWKHTFEYLPKFDMATGAQIVYAVEEAPVAGYDQAITPATMRTDGTVMVMNTLKTVDLSGAKTWVDLQNAHGTRPATVTIQLERVSDALADYETYGAARAVGEPWTWNFALLPKFDKLGNEYTYRVAETDLSGAYTVSQPAGLMNLTNTLQTIDLTVKGNWIDESNRYGSRPDLLQVTVTGNGKTYTGALVEIAGQWNYVFKNLPKYDASGAPIAYAIAQKVPAGYAEKSVQQPALNAEGTGYEASVTNELLYTSVTVIKRWSGNNVHPTIRFRVMDGATVIASDSIRPTETTKVFTNLPKYQPKSLKLIEYTVAEDPVNFYVPTYTRSVDAATNMVTLTITNTYVPERIVEIEVPIPGPTVYLPGGNTVSFGGYGGGGSAGTPNNVITIVDMPVPLGAGINLNAGDCFD